MVSIQDYVLRVAISIRFSSRGQKAQRSIKETHCSLLGKTVYRGRKTGNTALEIGNTFVLNVRCNMASTVVVAQSALISVQHSIKR